MVEGIDYVVSRMDWYMDVSNVLLENSWESNAAFCRFRGSMERSILKFYEAFLEYEMLSVAYCFKDHPIVQSMKTILGFNDWESRRTDLERIKAELDTSLSQYATREHLQHLHDLSSSAGVLGDIANDIR